MNDVVEVNKDEATEATEATEVVESTEATEATGATDTVEVTETTDTVEDDTDGTNNEDIPDNDSDVKKWKSLSRKNEKSFKEASAALEEEKAKLSEALTELQGLKREALITSIAQENSIPKEMLALLTGSEEKSLREQAALIASFAKQSTEQKQVIPSQGSNTQGVIKASRTEEVASFLRNRN